MAAAPRFVGEEMANWGDGPDPPDVLCRTASGKEVGVEITKWVEPSQLQTGIERERLENNYLKIVQSENKARPGHIGRVFLYDKGLRIAQGDAIGFRAELFDFLERENAKPEVSLDPQRSIPPGYWETVRAWETPQGAPVSSFGAYPLLRKYLDNVWIFPRYRRQLLSAGMPWILFETTGGPYTPEWMVKAAIDRIAAKIAKYGAEKLAAKHSLGEFDLLCHFCDEALLHNTPIEAAGFGFPQLAAAVKDALCAAPKVFDRIFLYHPFEDIGVVQVYGAGA